MPLQELETVQFIPFQVMDAIGAALEPADDDGAIRQVDVIPAQIASLGDPQTVAVSDQLDKRVAPPLPALVPLVGDPDPSCQLDTPLGAGP